MKNIKWIVLGYIMCVLINGCDLGITNSNEGIGVSSSELGSSPYNPIYVKVVD
tara:strand:- start:827 stop:985 length:159 start_codon:yes stop_codon:yes gene_type:complete